jgi:hypothetical protein
MAKRVDAVKAAIQAAPISNKQKKQLQKQANAIAASKGSSTAIGSGELNEINKLITLAGGTAVSAETTAKGYTAPVQEQPPREDPATTAQRMQQAAQTARDRQSAYDLARAFAEEYGIGVGIADRIIDLTANQGYTPTAVRLELQRTPEFKARFKGLELYKENFGAQIAAGSKAAALTPADYIQAEREYQEILSRYGLGSLGNQDIYAELVGGDVSAIELKDRVENVYDRIQNADDVLKEQLKTYFPQLEESDFAKALLTGRNPEDMANSLKRRISQAEISSEAARAGLGGLTAERAEELAAMGLSRTIARAGYSRIAEQKSRIETLGGIYKQDVSGIQEELEAEQFQGLASRRRKKITEQEAASFSARAGSSQVSLSQRTAGQF